MSDHVDPVERAQAEAFDRELYGDGGLGEALAAKRTTGPLAETTVPVSEEVLEDLGAFRPGWLEYLQHTHEHLTRGTCPTPDDDGRCPYAVAAERAEAERRAALRADVRGWVREVLGTRQPSAGEIDDLVETVLRHEVPR